MAANPDNLRPTGSKLDLIQATSNMIARHGLSGITSAKIAAAAGHTAASINFHFGSQQALLHATLSEVSVEFAEVIAAVLERTRGDDVASLVGIVDASLGRRLSEASKVAVWYAFLAESNARADYQRVCGERDQAFNRTLTELCRRLIAAEEGAAERDAEAIAAGLAGLIDQQWQWILFEGDGFDRDAAKRQCHAYLRSVFPKLRDRIDPPARTKPAAPATVTDTDPALRFTLPGWVYHNEEFHALEREKIFLPSWQVVGHASELPETGDYLTFELFGRRGFVVRGDDGALRAFHNVCRHRAHAVVGGERGHCSRFLTCAYHGWTYHLDGRNRSISAPDTFPKFDRSQFGLKPIELETWMGMVFVRFEGGGPSVAERMAPHQAEIAHYRMADMVPLDEPWVKDVEIDWKNVVENYVEDYHFPMGHPGLSALMEPRYDREYFPGGTMRLSHRMREKPLRSWSAQGYAKFLPVIEHLPEDMRRRWTYFGLFPNVFFDIYPEWLDYFHVLPLGPGRTRIRARSFGFKDDRREMKAARFFCSRLNSRVQAEDEVLTRSVQQGLESGAYSPGIVSSKEIVLAGFQDWIRERIPEARLAGPPAR